MSDLYVIFNHTLTAAQKKDAIKALGVERVVSLPETFQQLWSQIPAETDTLSEHLAPLQEWLYAQTNPGDFILIQGEFGATCLLIQFAKENALIPIYSTTDRQAVEEHQPDGSVKISHLFKHVRFRIYE